MIIKVEKALIEQKSLLKCVDSPWDIFYAVSLSEDSDKHFHVLKCSEFPLSKDYLEGQTFSTNVRLIYLNGKQIWSYWVRDRDNDASLKKSGII
jgi:hypothetical protein